MITTLENSDIDTLFILKFLGMLCCHMSVYTDIVFSHWYFSLLSFLKERKLAYDITVCMCVSVCLPFKVLSHLTGFYESWYV
jgi:hypothetical protein